MVADVDEPGLVTLDSLCRGARGFAALAAQLAGEA
jgi:hypothetical protein